jgi:hypothetical protein
MGRVLGIPTTTSPEDRRAAAQGEGECERNTHRKTIRDDPPTENSKRENLGPCQPLVGRVLASTGVATYLTKEAIAATLRQVATLAPGSTFTMSFMLPVDLVEPEERPGIESAARGARAAGTPFISFFSPPEILALAREAGFNDVKRVSAAHLAERYLAGRADGLRPSSGEELLVATT